MEFKKPIKHNEGRPKSAASSHVDSPQPVQQPETPSPSSTEKTINIRINFDSIPKLPSKTAVTSRVKKALSSKKIVLSAIAIVVVSLLIISVFAGQMNTSSEPSVSDKTNSLVENLEYQTVLPEGKTISELGGWKRVSPSKSDPVYAYADKIDNVPISVSQQPLPQSFKGSTSDQVAELAKKFNATAKLDAGTTQVYIGTSAKGPQSAILSKNGLLILIKSQQKITDKSWTKYVASLN